MVELTENTINVMKIKGPFAGKKQWICGPGQVNIGPNSCYTFRLEVRTLRRDNYACDLQIFGVLKFGSY